MRELLYLAYFVVGLAYWCVNIFVRKLHTKNEEGDGWFLTPLWLFGWPLCFVAIIAGFVNDAYEKRKL